MKAILSVLSILFLVVSASAQDEKPMKFKKKAPEYIFLIQVENAIKAHDADALLRMMEPGYKRSQHDEFLAGRTLQFLTEFFCYEIPFNEITGAQLISYKARKSESANQGALYDVRMFIQGSNKWCYADFFLVKHLETGVLSIYGAVG